LAQCVIVVFAAVTIAFVLLHAAPGDAFSDFEQAVGTSPEARAAIREHYGADKPVVQQYVMWLSNAVKGDLGWSPSKERLVLDVISDRLPNTILLMGLAFSASLLFGVLLGAWQGAHAGTRRDHAISALTLSLYSVPEFVLGLGLILLFVTVLGVLPASGTINVVDYDYMTRFERILDRLKHLVLPWLTLTTVATGVFARFQRASMRESMGEPFVRTARAKGLAENAVRRHARRAALLPVITVAGLLFPALLGGAVLVEKVFAWPGMGMLTYEAIMSHDYWLVCGVLVISSSMTAVGTLLADIARSLADPRSAAV
jgi:peptide/nickel transport system permease protein